MRHNRYGVNVSRQTPWVERLMKNVRHRLNLLSMSFAQRQRPPIIIAYPDLPSRRSALHKICKELKWELTNAPRINPKLCIRFEDQTEKNTPLPRWLTDAPTHLWNANCRDIRKSTLEQSHVAAFGYGMAVDPTAFTGPMVIKSEFNARHDGKIINGPIADSDKQQHCVYQLNIHNNDETGQYFDYRLVFIHGSIPLAYKKYKAAQSRFTNQCTSAHVVAVNEALDKEEIKFIGTMMHAIHVDYAELDALRDAQTGKLFVIDVNPTPWGPPAELPDGEKRIAIQTMAKAFENAINGSNPSNRT